MLMVFYESGLSSDVYEPRAIAFSEELLCVKTFLVNRLAMPAENKHRHATGQAVTNNQNYVSVMPFRFTLEFA